MPLKRVTRVAAIIIVLVAVTLPAQGQEAYDDEVRFMEVLAKDVIMLLPRAMGRFIYENRYDFYRGMTFTFRDLRSDQLKLRELEELKRQAFARLSRDIPYCVEAFKGGEFKLDTSPGNLSGRLGMIAYSTMLQNLPPFPDLEYFNNFYMQFEQLLGANIIDVWVYYDGYGDFNSLGEVMERLRPKGLPELTLRRNPYYPVKMKEDTFSMFRPPNKHDAFLLLTDVELNDMYNEIINDIADVYVYIWKCSGMDLSHPSYSAPPGTTISRPSRRRQIRGAVAAVPSLPETLTGEAQKAEPRPIGAGRGSRRFDSAVGCPELGVHERRGSAFQEAIPGRLLSVERGLPRPSYALTYLKRLRLSPCPAGG